MPDYVLMIIVSLGTCYVAFAIFVGLESLECSHGKTGWQEDLRIAWEAAAWPVALVPWREGLSMWLPAGKHHADQLVIAP